jgi:hypothetical protein
MKSQKEGGSGPSWAVTPWMKKLNEKKMKIHSNFTVLKNVVWVKSPAFM